MKGDKGDTRPAGPEGPAGKDGSDGWRPTAWLRCAVALDLIAPGSNGERVRGKDGLYETALDYAVMSYSNRDFEVQCTAELGSADQGSGSGYYPTPTLAASDRRCTANSDYNDLGDGTAAGFWYFSAQAGKVRAVYMDSDNPLDLNNAFYEFTDDDCAAKTMNNKGAWSDITMAALFE